jgi:hypothetical protein
MSDDTETNSVYEHVTEVEISASRRVQLDQYEPIEESCTLTIELPDHLSEEERRSLVESTADEAWEEADRGVMKRYENHLRKEDE